MYGTIDGLEPIAVTNERGEFELAQRVVHGYVARSAGSGDGD